MFGLGALVILTEAKQHGEDPETALTIRGGICGMIVDSRTRNGEHTYVVDFGSEGQWHCIDSELEGDEEEGFRIPEVAEPPIGGAMVSELEIGQDSVEPEPRPTPSPGLAPALFYDEPPTAEEDGVMVDVEADIAKRMKEIEEGESEKKNEEYPF